MLTFRALALRHGLVSDPRVSKGAVARANLLCNLLRQRRCEASYGRTLACNTSDWKITLQIAGKVD